MPDFAIQRVLDALSVLPPLQRRAINRRILDDRNAVKNAYAEARAIIAAGGGMEELRASDNAIIRAAVFAEVGDDRRP